MRPISDNKRVINDERNPGEDAFKSLLRTAPKPEWQKALARESILIPWVLRSQRTFRAAKLVPLWSAFEFSEPGWTAKRQLDSTDWRKFRAWWELLLEVQRHPEDKKSVELALFYVAQHVTGIRRAVDYAKHGITAEHASKVEDAVRVRIKDLHPVEVAPGADLRSLMLPKYEKQ